jgi:hypothetical protein
MHDKCDAPVFAPPPAVRPWHGFNIGGDRAALWLGESPVAPRLLREASQLKIAGR